MQQRSCEQIGLLLSKYADGEATPAERARVESHLASCADCSRKLVEFSQLASLLTGPALRDPEPSLRVDLFRQIRQVRQEEEEARKRAEERLSWLPRLPYRVPAPRRSFAGRVWSVASPFMVASAAVFTLLGLVFFLNHAPSSIKPPVESVNVPVAVPTAEPPVQAAVGDGGVPQAVPTDDSRINALMSPSVPAGLASATAFATAIAEGLFQLSQATPVLEDADPRNMSSWHAFRDPVYGYAVSYPPNWWTYSLGDTRVFTPWPVGSNGSIPFQVEVRVSPNSDGLSVSNAAARLFNGNATIIRDRQGHAVWVRHTAVDHTASYDDLYSFDAQNTYRLRLAVSVAGSWHDAESLFSSMTGTFSMPVLAATAGFGYAPIVFLNGTDLFMIQPNGQSLALTHGYGVRQFALSPDMRTLVFATAKNSNDIWANSLYILRIDSDNVSSPGPLWTGAQEVHDFAWYGDREVVAIAQSSQDGLGIFRIPVANVPANAPGDAGEPRLIRALPDTMAGARGLAVAPDRQLITFLAPLGEHAGTDLYAVRPDGQDLDVLVSHADPVSPSDSNGRIFTRDSQALKSYVWVDGHLDTSGYRFHVLLTCGNAASPTFFRGGFLYSAPGAISNVLLNHRTLSIQDANEMQIVHLAYSGGKLAMTGYYSDRNGRADLLAGLWVASIGQNGALSDIRSLPIPANPHGIADLEWSPDGRSLIYRETVPQGADSLSSRYEAGAQSPFTLVKLDPTTGERTDLYSSR